MYNTSAQESSTKRNPTKWGWIFIALGVVQIVLIALIISVYLQAVEMSRAGESGSEIIVLAVFMRVVPLVGLISLINIICLPAYMLVQRPYGKTRIFNAVSLALSTIIILYAIYVFTRYV